MRLPIVFLLAAGLMRAADYPAPAKGDYVIKDFRFQSGDTLPGLRIHYRTVGTPRPS
jgi:homoserine O-acetyltransferase